MTNSNPFLRSPLDTVADDLNKQASDTMASLPTYDPAPAAPLAPEPSAPAMPSMPAQAIKRRPPKSNAKGAGLMPPPDLMPLFEASADAYGVPVNVLMALASQESGYRADAVGVPTKWGRAKGMMQNLDSTAQGLGINPFDPNQAVPAAAMQIRQRLDNGMSMEDAVMEHFAGPDRKQWGEKTAQYGAEVMDRVARIGKELMAMPAAQVAAEPVPAVPAKAGMPAPAKPAKDEGFLDRAGNAVSEGFDGMVKSLGTARFAMGGGDSAALAKELATKFNTPAKPKTPGELENDAAFKAVTDANGFWDTAKAGVKAVGTALSNPSDTAIEIARQLPNTLPTIGGGVAGAGTGAAVGAGVGALAAGVGAAPGAVGGAVWGGRAGMVAGTTAVELGAEIEHVLQERLAAGNLKPTEQNIKALLDDPAFRDEARNQGLKKGLTVGLVDQIFLGLGGKVAGKAAGAATKAGKVGLAAGAVGVDATGEVIGEAASQKVARGHVDAGEALREGVMSLGQSVVEPAIGAAMQAARGRSDVPLSNEQQIADAINQEVENTQFVGHDAAARAALDPNNEAIDPRQTTRTPGQMPQQAAPVSAPVEQAAPPAPAAPVDAEPAEKPMAAAMADVAKKQTQRVKVVLPGGEIEGTLVSLAEDGQGGFAAEFMDDEGEVVTITHEDGAQLVPVEQAPAGPMSAALAEVSQGAPVEMVGQQAAAEAQQAAPYPELDSEPVAEQIAAPDFAAEIAGVDHFGLNARVQRIQGEQKKREGLLADDRQLSEYAAERGMSADEMAELLATNHEDNISRLAAYQDALAKMAKPAKAKVKFTELTPDDPVGAELMRQMEAELQQQAEPAARQPEATVAPEQDGKSNPYAPYRFTDAKIADNFMNTKAVDRSQFAAVKTGQGRFEIKRIDQGAENVLSGRGLADDGGRSSADAVRSGPTDGTGLEGDGLVPEFGSGLASGLGQSDAADRTGASAPTVDAQALSDDPLYQQAVDAVMSSGRASVSGVQRELKIGYNRVQRIFEEMERNGLVGPMASNGAREISKPAPAKRQPPKRNPPKGDALEAAKVKHAKQDEAVRVAAENIEKRKTEKESTNALQEAAENGAYGVAAMPGDAAVPADATSQSSADVAVSGVASAPVPPVVKRQPAKRNPTPKQKAAAQEAALAEHFTPGNIVKNVSGHDRVIAYEPPTEANGYTMKVKVQAVVKQGDNWVPATGPEGRERSHSTMPDARALKDGPVVRGDKGATIKDSLKVDAPMGSRFSVSGGDGNSTSLAKAKTGKLWVGEVFHGTAGDEFSAFRPRVARSVWFAPDSRYAKKYADSRQGGNRRVMAVRVTLNNPLVIDMKGEQDLPQKGRQGAMKYANTIEDAVGVAQQWGHDGVIFKNRKLTDEGYSSEEVAVFNQEQIEILPSETPGAKFSSAASKVSGMTIATLAEHLALGPVGETIALLVDASAVRIHTSALTVPGTMPEGVQAATTPDGTIHLVAGNLTEKNALGVLLHEAFHQGAEKLVGGKAWDELMGRIAALQRQGKSTNGAMNQFWRAAARRVEAATAQGAVDEGMSNEEFAAYAIEEYASAPPTIQKWVDSMVGAVKAWMVARFGKQVGDVTPAQLRALAVMALKDAGKGGKSGTAFSVSGNRAPVTLKEFENLGGGFSVEGRDLLRDGAKIGDLRLAIEDGPSGQFVVVRDISIRSKGQGTGTMALSAIMGTASRYGMPVALTTESMLGKAHQKRLRAYYERLGFKKNRGENKVKGISEEYVWKSPETRFSVADRTNLDDVSEHIDRTPLAMKVNGGLAALKRHGMLPSTPMNYLADFARPNMTAVKKYMGIKRAMDAYRGEKHSEFDAHAQGWLKFNAQNKDQAKELANLMHDSTLAQIDPSADFVEGTDAAAYAALQKRYNALTTDGKRIYNQTRDMYGAQAKELDGIITANLKRTMEVAREQAEARHKAKLEELEQELTGTDLADAVAKAKAAHFKRWGLSAPRDRKRLAQLREIFESNRLSGPYFPLSRFGDYFVAVRDAAGEMVGFSKFEGLGEAQAYEQEVRKANPSYKIKTGLMSNRDQVRGAVDGKFLADVENILIDSGVPDDVQDEIWQRYLTSMPDLSMRKRFIHRKGTQGFSQDALRAFASTMFHGSHQLARMKFAPQMEVALDEMRKQADESDKPIEATMLVNEFEQRHQWVMNPKGGKAAQMLSSIAFTWNLAATPAAAIINTTQTFMMGVPVLGAKLGGMGKAMAALSKASGQLLSAKHWKLENNPSLSADERAALDEFYRLGLIDKTQSHDLAGVGDTGVEYNALRARVMKTISFMYHHAERVNREVTALAAYRMAREAGQGHDQAIETSAELTWATHFDYSSSNRPRIIQNDAAKILMIHRQHSINMTYRLFRDIHQSFKGETAAARKEARTQFVGIMGMHALMAGVKGLPFYGLAMVAAGLLTGFGDDDEKMTPEMRLQAAMREAMPEWMVSTLIYGAPSKASGLALTGRIGFPDFFFRTPNKELEGKDEAWHYAQQILGAGIGLPVKWYSGLDIMRQGHIRRGMEYMMPKALADLSKAGRYASEGVLNMKGDAIVDQVAAWEVLAQASGFSPHRVSEQYDKNAAKVNLQTAILRARSNMINRASLAKRLDDDEAFDEVLEDIDRFNDKYPEVKIMPRNIIQNARTKERNAERANGGVVLNRKLEGRIESDLDLDDE